MKHKFKAYSIFLLLMLSLNCMAAVKIVECEDEEGNRSFQKVCPPGSEELNQKRIATGSKAAAENKPVTFISSNSSVTATMYSIPICSPCDAVRELLQVKKISLNEINIEGDIITQAELTKLNGSLNVPITLIGDKKLSGYNRTEILAALKEAGWEDPDNKDKE